MTGFTSGRHPRRHRPLVGAGILAAALGLGGCNSMTYGTGTSPGMQTLQDLTGMVTLGAKKPDPIDYTPRPKIVAPPTVADLPPPGEKSTATAANWPNDPDAARAKIRAAAAERDAKGLAIDTSVIPKTNAPVDQVSQDPNHIMTPEEQAKAKKLFADARGGVAVDENGNPVRRYLSDPPSDYRMPDPASPTALADMPKKKKPFKWFWQ